MPNNHTCNLQVVANGLGSLLFLYKLCKSENSDSEQELVNTHLELNITGIKKKEDDDSDKNDDFGDNSEEQTEKIGDDDRKENEVNEESDDDPFTVHFKQDLDKSVVKSLGSPITWLGRKRKVSNNFSQ